MLGPGITTNDDVFCISPSYSENPDGWMHR